MDIVECIEEMLKFMDEEDVFNFFAQGFCEVSERRLNDGAEGIFIQGPDHLLVTAMKTDEKIDNMLTLMKNDDETIH